MSSPTATLADVSAVSTFERKILAAEGPYHVEGRYYANPDDADRQRRWTAERMQREATRREQWAARVGAAEPPPQPRVSTWLAPRERAQVDAAAGAHLSLEHRDSLAGIGRDLSRGWADAGLVSAAIVNAADGPALAGFVRGFPGVAFAAVVTDATSAGQALAAAHMFGQAGVRVLIDCRGAGGWAALRGTFAPRHLADAFLRACVGAVLADLRDGEAGRDVADGLARFFATVFAPDVTRAQQIAARLGVCPSTLVSRFYRAGLPSPKRYVGWARLVWAARLGESPALSLSTIAHRLDASSPQSFQRTVRTLTGLPASEFRRRFNGAAMLDQFRAELVAPYREALRDFDPTTARPLPPPLSPAASAGVVPPLVTAPGRAA